MVTAVLAGRLPAMGLGASLRSLFYPTDIPAAHAALARFDLTHPIPSGGSDDVGRLLTALEATQRSLQKIIGGKLTPS